MDCLCEHPIGSKDKRRVKTVGILYTLTQGVVYISTLPLSFDYSERTARI